MEKMQYEGLLIWNWIGFAANECLIASIDAEHLRRFPLLLITDNWKQIREAAPFVTLAQLRDSGRKITLQMGVYWVRPSNVKSNARWLGSFNRCTASRRESLSCVFTIRVLLSFDQIVYEIAITFAAKYS